MWYSVSRVKEILLFTSDTKFILTIQSTDNAKPTCLFDSITSPFLYIFYNKCLINANRLLKSSHDIIFVNSMFLNTRNYNYNAAIISSLSSSLNPINSSSEPRLVSLLSDGLGSGFCSGETVGTVDPTTFFK